MPMSLQVMYPITADTNFDYDYYSATHMPLVDKRMGAHIDDVLITKGIAGGPDVPPGMYAVATMIFSDQAALGAALAAAGPVIGDIPNFTNSTPQMLIGEVIS